MISNTLCSAAWTDINIDFGNRKIRHCCKSKEFSFPENLTVEFFNNSAEINTTRKNLANGIEDSFCTYCWNDYKKTGTAYRDFKNEWASNLDISNKIKTIEIMLDNLCDMSCIYCDEWASSKIASEKKLKKRFNVARNEDLDVFIKFIEELSLKQNYVNLSFSGGEVTYSKSFYYFVENLIKNKNLHDKEIRFAFLTNGNTTEANMSKILELLNSIPPNWYVHVSMSMEIFGKDAELVRYGLNWERFIKNFETYYQHPKVGSMLFAPTLNIFTVKKFPEFVMNMSKYLTKFEDKKQISIFGNWVNEPDILSPAYSNPKYKDEIENLISYLEIDTTFNTPEFIKFLKTLKEKVGSKPMSKEMTDRFLTLLSNQKDDISIHHLRDYL